MRTLVLSAVIAASTAFAPAAFAAPNASSATASSSSTIIQPITIGKDVDLAFGRVVKPSSGNGTVTIGTDADAISVSGAVALAGVTTTRAKFTISGEGAQAVAITVPATMTMTNPAGDSLTVNLTSGLGSQTTLSGSLGGAGSATLYVGGDFTLASTTPTGQYTGTFQVDVAYQ